MRNSSEKEQQKDHTFLFLESSYDTEYHTFLLEGSYNTKYQSPSLLLEGSDYVK